ncbi:HNH endonuclease [Sphingopyxis sp. NJF-3]
MGERIRGRKGVELRKRRLRAEPLCRMCKAEGIIRQADVVDHIKPLGQGGEDIDENCQSLCHAHHDAKTASEGGANLFGATHPEWLRPSAIPLTIICGPPASGKTTYARDRAKPGDIVIDLDAISMEIDPTFRPWSGRSNELLNASLRKRNEVLGSLCRQAKGRAWFIVGAPTKGERQWWRTRLGGDVVLLNPGYAECLKRSKARGTPTYGVDDWFKASGEVWRKQRAAMDGWDE